jgi:hypothetical protein
MRKTGVVVLFVSALTATGVALGKSDADAQHVGVSSCAGSSCHGAVASWQRWEGSAVRQDEFVTWQRKDQHALAYEALKGDRSARIAKNLGIGDAWAEPLCLDCHSDNADKRGPMHRLSSGVGCESCHGGARSWMPSHMTGTHRENLAKGLVQLEDPETRAGTCIGCHVGEGDTLVTHRIMGAGHPRMRFELDTFSEVMPAHHTVDADYTARKGEVDPARMWAIGQAVVALRWLELLDSQGQDGLFPELVFYDCHGCHHPMEELTWAPRPGMERPGVPRLEDSHLLMLELLVPVLGTGDDLRAARLDLQAAVTPEERSAAVARVTGAVVSLKKAATDHRFTEDEVAALEAGVVRLGLEQEYLAYAAAEQAVMTLGALYSATGRDHDTLEPLYATVESAETYRQAAFVEALKAL